MSLGDDSDSKGGGLKCVVAAGSWRSVEEESGDEEGLCPVRVVQSDILESNKT